METFEEADFLCVRGRIRAFGHLTPAGITHTRTVKKHRQKPLWLVTDEISDTLGRPMQQHWHPAEGYEKLLRIEARDGQGQPLEMVVEDGWYSGFYGKRMAAARLTCTTRGTLVTTEIELLDPNLPIPVYADMPLDEA